MNIMYVRRKTNTTAVSTNNEEQPQAQPAQPSSMLRRFRSKRSLMSKEKDETSPILRKQQQQPTSKTESLADLHSELQVLAASDDHDGGNANGKVDNNNNNNNNGTGIRRLLKGKKLVRVVKKRVPGRHTSSSDTLESHTTTTDNNTNNNANGSANGSSTDNNDGTRKVLRVKVKRKKKEDLNNNNNHRSIGGGGNDVDSMAPVGALTRTGGGHRRKGRSDASVGTGIVSRAISWFTFGGIKVGSGGRDFLGVQDDDEEEEEDDDDLLLDGGRTEYGEDDYTKGRTEYGDDYTNADVRTTTTPPQQQQQQQQQQHKNETKPVQTTSSMVEKEYSSPRQQTKLVSSLRTTTATTTATSSTNATPPSTPKPRPTSTVPPKSPGTPTKSPKSPRVSNGLVKRKTQPRAPVQEIIPQPGAPRKPPLTGVALRRLQIQEEWLSKGCNYQPNEVLRSTLVASATQQQQQQKTNGNHNTNDKYNATPQQDDDVSEISFDEPIVLVMGPDAPAHGEVAFWTHTTTVVEATYGSQHGRTAEALLNRGVAALNARTTGTAIECFLEAVNLCQDKYECQSNMAAARALHLLGSAFFLDGQLPMAAEATLKALEIRKAALGPFHTDTVDTFSNLAMVYLKQGKLLEAARIFTEVLQIRTAIYNAWHPSVAFPARSLAAVYAKRQDKDRARQSYLRALQCFEKHGMLAEHMDTEAEMRRFGIPPPVEEEGRTEI